MPQRLVFQYNPIQFPALEKHAGSAADAQIRREEHGEESIPRRRTVWQVSVPYPMGGSSNETPVTKETK